MNSRSPELQGSMIFTSSGTSMNDYFIQRKPFKVPTEDNKLILEHFGLASDGSDQVSIAHMTAPAGWIEPFQSPDFDEFTLVLKGKKRFEIGEEIIDLHSGESIRINKGVRVRYSNPFENPCEYIAICMPAFSIERAKREA